MKVIADTCVWSLALRRHNSSSATTKTLGKLISESRIQMLGPIRQELLSGITVKSQFTKLQTYLAAFPDLAIISTDYEQAAEYFNTCRNRGIQGSHIDFLICAVANRHQSAIFTVDKDFVSFAKILAINLYQA